MPRSVEATAALRADDVSGNKATARVLKVLGRFADGSDSYGVSELARELGMTKNMVYRALTTLTRHGYLVRDESGARYQLGFALVRLGQAQLDQLDLPSLCAPFMREMRDATGETVTLSVPAGRNVVTIDGIRGRGALARRVPLGRLTPLHASPASRAVLAFLADDELEAYLAGGELERFTETTIVEADALRGELAAVRSRGYALSLGDHVAGPKGAAFPVLDREGHPHGALTVAGPADRFTDRRLDETLSDLQRITAALNRRSRLYSAPQPPPETEA